MLRLPPTAISLTSRDLAWHADRSEKRKAAKLQLAADGAMEVPPDIIPHRYRHDAATCELPRRSPETKRIFYSIGLPPGPAPWDFQDAFSERAAGTGGHIISTIADRAHRATDPAEPYSPARSGHQIASKPSRRPTRWKEPIASSAEESGVDFEEASFPSQIEAEESERGNVGSESPTLPPINTRRIQHLMYSHQTSLPLRLSSRETAPLSEPSTPNDVPDRDCRRSERLASVKEKGNFDDVAVSAERTSIVLPSFSVEDQIGNARSAPRVHAMPGNDQSLFIPSEAPQSQEVSGLSDELASGSSDAVHESSCHRLSTPPSRIRVYNDSILAASQPQTPVGLPRHGLPPMHLTSHFTAPAGPRRARMITRSAIAYSPVRIARSAEADVLGVWREPEASRDQENSGADIDEETRRLIEAATLAHDQNRLSSLMDRTPPREDRRRL